MAVRSPEWCARHSAHMRARWADPVQRLKMLAASEKGVRAAAEAKRRRHPMPTSKQDRSKYQILRRELGLAATRKAFGLDQQADQ